MGEGLKWDLAYGVMQGGSQEEWRFQEDDGDAGCVVAFMAEPVDRGGYA